jgi:hypothetical protein
MPYKSLAQSRFIHAKASEGKDWAKKFISHSHGEKVPKVQHVKRSKLAEQTRKK